MVTIRQMRTDGRAAFENIPDVVQPVSFIIEMIGFDGKPLTAKSFQVGFDDGKKTSVDTDENGLLKISKSSKEFDLGTDFDTSEDKTSEQKFYRYKMDKIAA
jgi:hypothetical protein